MASLTDVKGISDSRAEKFIDADYLTVDDVATATAEDISDDIHGVGETTAQNIIESAQDVLMDDTLEDDGVDVDEEEMESDAEEAVSEDDVVVTKEDLEGLNDEPPEDYDTPGEMTVESDEDEPRNVDVQEKVPVELELHTPEYYDYLMYTLMELKLGNLNGTAVQTNQASEILEEVREIEGTGGLTLHLDQGELNTLHFGLNQAQQRFYGGDNTTPFEVVRDLKRQINDVREEYFL